MKKLIDIRSKINEKLQTLTASDKPLAKVYDYHTLENEGQWPYLSFEPINLTGEILDSCNNLRSYTFDLLLFQEINETLGRDGSLEILINSFESIVDLFDKDFTLSGEVLDTNVASGDIGQYVGANGTTLFANIKITCKVSIDINI